MGLEVSFGASLAIAGAGFVSLATGLATEIAFIFGGATACLSCPPDGPSRVAGRFTGCVFLGGVSGCFSRVFDAEDVVGLIILARNPSSAGAVGGRLCLDDCPFTAAGGGPSDGLLLPLFRVEGLRFKVEVAVLARLGDRDSAWCACREFVG